MSDRALLAAILTALERIAQALERIADQGDAELNDDDAP